MLLPRTGAVGAAERHTIRQTGVTIGRGEDNDVVIDDPSVSEHHAHLVLTGGVWTVADLGSVNGTTVDGLPVDEPLPLATGSTLRLGVVDLVFSPHDRWQDSIPPEPPALDTADIAARVGGDFALGLPERRGFPVPLIVGFAITVMAILGYLLSQGG